MQRFDLIAIGGGTAGLVTAAGAAALGLRVALVERESLGGDCLWTGCVPSKALIASAKLAHQMRHADELGLAGASPAHVFGRVMDRMRAAREQIARHDDPERFRRMGVDVVFGSAELGGTDRLTVDGHSLQAKRIVVATGAMPAVPSIPGLEEAGYLTHLTAFDQTSLPRRIALLGGGPVGIEFAQVYSRLGAEVTVLEMLPQLLPREEPEAAKAIARALEAEGIALHVGAKVERVERTAAGHKMVYATTESGESIAVPVDEIFVATGRRANTEGLGLEQVGVLLERGAIKTDAALRSSVPGIWAAGDVAGGPQFTHVADYHAKLVLRNAVFPFSTKLDYSAVPAVTYVDPEVARVGLTEVEARERFGEAQVYRYEMTDLDRAIVDGHDAGFVKIVTRRGGKIVGATVVASGAGDLLIPLVMAVKQGIKLPKLSQLVYPYPTMSEGIKRAADSYYREKLAGRPGEWLKRVVRWLK
jgi:pyruvate/2-oxoglutarate dehydrogenase complex dihydrolipoamide dehydrogenase (E3) component